MGWIDLGRRVVWWLGWVELDRRVAWRGWSTFRSGDRDGDSFAQEPAIPNKDPSTLGLHEVASIRAYGCNNTINVPEF